MYNLPQFNVSDAKNRFLKFFKNKVLQSLFLLFIIIVALAFASGKISFDILKNQYDILVRDFNAPVAQNTIDDKKPVEGYVSNITYEQAIIDAVKSASPSVVSIVISKYVPIYEQQFIDPFGGLGSPFGGFNIQIPQQVQKGRKYQEVGSGSGFIVSEDGLVLTNKHVVLDKQADYVVITLDGKKYDTKVLARDPVQDLAIMKIQLKKDQVKSFPSIKIGDSDGIQIGQGVIAIGNALGQFSNTVSVGVVSGLGRTVDATGGQGFSETLKGIIQTDAAINLGNSGGPLINLKGEVIGVNTAMADNAQSIGFAIPINVAKRDIDQIIKTNKITYPFLGVRYVIVNDEVKAKYKLSVDYGAYVIKGRGGEAAVTAGSAAQKAGIKEGDVILEIHGNPLSSEIKAGGAKITTENPLDKVIVNYNPGDKVILKVLRDGKETDIEVTLGERPQ